MKRFITFFIFLLNFIIQTTILREFQIMGVIPNTTLVLVVLFSLLFKNKDGIIYGVIFGLVHDVYYGPIIGLSSLLYFVIGYIISEIKKSVYKDTVFSSLVLTVASAAFFHVAFYIFIRMYGMDKSMYYILPNIAIEIVLDLAFAYVTYKVFVRTYSQLREKGFR